MYSYCAYCHVGQEKYTADRLGITLPESDIIIPMRVLEERRESKWETVERVLLPGYIFVYSNDRICAGRLRNGIQFLKNVDNSLELFGKDHAYAMWLHKYGGRIGSSSIITQGKAVRVIKGPLKDQIGKIVKVDKHKRRAVIEIDFYGQSRRLSVTVNTLSTIK